MMLSATERMYRRTPIYRQRNLARLRRFLALCAGCGLALFVLVCLSVPH